jgi:hypothetical protein
MWLYHVLSPVTSMVVDIVCLCILVYQLCHQYGTSPQLKRLEVY